jgi:cytochrome o ubiquinol oxidase subunit 2
MRRPVRAVNQTSMLRIAIILGVAACVGGCAWDDFPVISPKGPVAQAERDLLFNALLLMLIVLIPVFLMTALFAWRYRASNSSARYEPDWCSSLPAEAVIWLVPTAIVLALGLLLWHTTHKVDPYRPLASPYKPLEVQAVAQDWKWLFIYPEQNIATVNELVFPDKTSVNLRITSDTVMNSLYIPALAGQIYAMAGMQTRLSLMADEPGRFLGRNTQYSGDGFSNQHFWAQAVTLQDFDAWVARVRQSSDKLTTSACDALAKPSIGHAVTYYSAVEPKLFETIIAKYAGRYPHGRVPTKTSVLP